MEEINGTTNNGNSGRPDRPAGKKRKKTGRKILRFIATYPKLILIILAVLLVGFGAVSIRDYIDYRNKTSNIGFENIGELATQSAICTEVHVTDDWKKMFGKVNIPFTQSKYIYSYDFEIKAGYDFSKIEWSEKNKVITVKLPEAKILSNTPITDSFKVYHEEESAFNRITLEENTDAFDSMQQQAEADAIENGLLDRARSNAEVVLTGFFGKVYDLKEYKIKFTE